MHYTSRYIAHKKSVVICIIYNIDTFIQLNGYRLRINAPLLITYSNETYFTIYVARYLYPALPSQPKPTIHHRARAHHIIPFQKVSYTSVEVIWFDTNILLNLDDTLKTKNLLKQSTDRVRFYTNRRLMIDEIKSMISSSIFLIISGIEAYDVLSEIHSLSQLDTVFIFCSFISKYKVLEQKYPKVVGVFNRHDKMIGSLRSQLNHVKEENTLKNLYKDVILFDRISPTLWWTRLLRSYLTKEHKTDTYSKDDMIKMCYPYFRSNKSYQKAIFDFEMNYDSRETVNWYTRDTFLYRIVNQALRAADYYAVYTFRHYVIELSEHLEKLHSNLRRTLCGAIGKVYRGAVMSKQEFEKIRENIGKLVITKSFVSTTWDLDVVKPFADIDNQTIRDTVSVILEISMDPCLDEDCRCADLSHISNMKSEAEILFDIGSVFRVISVDYVDKSNYWYVKMKSSESRGYNTAERYFNCITRDLTCLKQDIACGRLLVEMGMFEEALTHHERMQQFVRSKRDVAQICLSIGRIYNQREQQSDAIIALVYYYWALQHDETASRAYDLTCKLLCQLSPPERVLKWPVNSENIAYAYYRLNQMKEARDLYLELVGKCLNTANIDYLKLGQHLTNLASTFQPLEAYIIYKYALHCLQRILPLRHPLILKIQTSLSTLSCNKTLHSARPVIKVFIRLSSTHFSRIFLVEPSDTVKQLKERLEKFYHIQHHEQILIYNNQVLNDSQSFESYITTNEVSLVWKVSPVPKTRVIGISIERKLICLRIPFTYSIFHIKQWIHIKYRYPSRSIQQLFFRNKELDDDTLVYHSLCSVPRSNLIHTVKKPTKRIVFHIEMLVEYDTIQVNCDPSQVTVRRLKKIVERERGVPVRFQRILFDNQELAKGQAFLAMHNVKHHTTLSLDLTINSTITSTVIYKTNEIIIKISPRATIRELKEELNKQLHVPACDQKLLLLPAREQLSPDHHSILKALKDCQNVATLNIAVELIVLSNMRMSDIQVTYSDRESIDKITINTFITIGNLKKIISKNSKIKTQNIKLYANGEKIDAESIEWSDTGIAKEQTVFVYHTDPIDSFLIKIRLLNRDNPFEIRFPGTATIKLLKQFLEHCRRINSEEQRLFYQTNELNSFDEPLRQFAGRIIDVLRCTDTFIFLQYSTFALEHKIIPIGVKPNDIIAILKKKAEKKLNTSLEQHLLSSNKKSLKNYDNLLSSFIEIGDTLHVYPSPIPIQYIYVQLPGTLERIPIEFNKSMTVKEVHGKIFLYLGLSEDQQQISFRDHQLDDKNQSLEFYEIIPNSILQLIHVISLRIVMTNNCFFSVTINQFSNIDQLKSIICQKGFAMSIDEQKLIYFGVQLKNDLKVKQCRFENNSVVLLLTKNDEKTDKTSFNHDQFDQFATKREKIWLSRLGHIDDYNDGSSVTDDDDSDSSNNGDDKGNTNESDDDDQHDDYSNTIRHNNRSRKIMYLFKDDDDTDDSLHGIVCYRADQK